MHNIDIALMGYVSWTLLLLLIMVSRRSFLTIAKRKPANSFATDGQDLGGFDQRLVRAHANCIENLPIFGSIALFCIFKQYHEITDKFALILLGARIAQSTVHLISTRTLAVYARFTFFVIQLGIMVEWLWCIFTVK